MAADHTPEELLEVLQLAVAMPAVGTATNILEDICTSGAASGLDLKAVKQLAAAAIKVQCLLLMSCQPEITCSLMS